MTLFCGVCYLCTWCVFCALYDTVRTALALVRLGRQIMDIIRFRVLREISPASVLKVRWMWLLCNKCK